MGGSGLARGARIFLGLCAAATLAIGIHMARPWGDNDAYQGAKDYLVLAAMLLWALFPLGALALATHIFRSSPRARAVLCIGAIGIGLAGMAAYVDVAFVHRDAQGGLAFVSVPVLQWIGTLGLLAVCAVLQRLRRPVA